VIHEMILDWGTSVAALAIFIVLYGTAAAFVFRGNGEGNHRPSQGEPDDHP
jgi:hypothetical protein